MYPVSESIENWLRKRDREFVTKAEVNGIEYFDDVLIDFTIENSLSLSDELELGTAIPNKLIIRFRTQQEFPPNAKIVPYLALSADNLTWMEADIAWEDADFAWEGGHTDWMPLGEFYVDNRTVDRGIWTYTCYDKLVFADVPYISQLSYPTTMRAVWDEICTRIGFTYDDSVVIDPTYTIGAGPAGYSCRQVMGFIASANSACVYMGKDGVLKFRKISATSDPVFEMTEADYIRAKQVNPIKSYSRVVVVYDVDDGLFYEAGSGDDSQTLFVDNPFGTQQMANDILAQINGFSYTPISMPARGFPHLDQGDIIGFETVESVAWQDADIAWDDADFPWNGVYGHRSIILHQVLDFKGGLSMQIEAPSISEQQSEFVVEGSLEQQVNRLNRNAVRYKKPYYGVTHSREEGIVVQREDGKAKAVFNADELTFYKGSEKALWFDVPNDRYMFSGTIEASDFKGGTITIGSGNNVFKVASNGIWAGHSNFNSAPFSVNMQGKMKVADGEFSGEITASDFIGGNITGTTITGGLIQTSESSYPRVEIRSDSQMIRAATSASNSIDILAYHAGFPYIQYRNGSDVTDIWMQPEFFQIGGDKEIRLQTLSHISLFPSGDIFLYPGGTVRVQNWSRIINNTTGRTLAQDLAGGGFTGGVFVDSGGLTLVLDFENGLLINAYYAGS